LKYLRINSEKDIYIERERGTTMKGPLSDLKVFEIPTEKTRKFGNTSVVSIIS